MRLLSVDEIAKRTGMTVAFWRKQILLRAIEVVRVGRSVRVEESVLERWLRERTTAARSHRMEQPGAAATA